MSCRKAFDIDLAAFLADARADEFAAFRDHYPRCPQCAAEVRAWTELHTRLAGAADHPPPSTLLRYEEEPQTLSAAERGGVESHLRGCAPCRDELASLRGFDPATLGRPEAERGGLRAWLAPLRRVVWQPAFAYAVLLLVLLPVVYAQLDPGRAAAPLSASSTAPELVVGGEESKAPGGRPAARPSAPAPALARQLAKPAPAEIAADVPSSTQAPPPAPPAVLRKEQAPPGSFEPSAEPKVELRETAGIVERDLEAIRERGSRDLAARPGRPDAPAAAGAATEREARRLTQVGRTAAGALQFTRLEEGVLALRVPVSAEAGAATVRIVSPDGRRELVEHFPAARGEPWVELRVPASWVGEGEHRVELSTPSGVRRFLAAPAP